MYCRHLALTNFRSYPRLELDLAPNLSMFWGDNGQGKSNLLEAVYLLATTRSFRTSDERELVNWYADTQPAFARVAAEVVRHQATTRIEMVLADPTSAQGQPGAVRAEAPAPVSGRSPAASVRRRVRINGQNRSPIDLLGHLNVVLFSPEDVELIAGPAEHRRRFLDITLSQVDPRYLRTLRRYVHVLQQRNALLRVHRERPAGEDQFEYWDAQLVELGADVLVARLKALEFLNSHLAEVHARLAGQEQPLRAEYRATTARPASDSPADARHEPAIPTDAGEIQERFRLYLATIRPRERRQGVTLGGPHRDDLAFFLGDVDLRAYGSRGQQRTAALSLKLAQLHLMRQYTSEHPVLLLDDVFSELDPTRRRLLQTEVLTQQQVLLTATDLETLSPQFRAAAQMYRVSGGAVTPGGPSD